MPRHIIDTTTWGDDFKRKYKEHNVMNNSLAERLQMFNLDRINIDEAIELSATAKILRAEYELATLTTPLWLDDGVRKLTTFISGYMQDSIAKRLRELEQEEIRDRDKTERKAAREAERAELKAKLGQNAPTTA